MTSSDHLPGHPDDHIRRTVHQAEGYLLWQAEITEAQRAAHAFADRLGWLTTGQREDVLRAYTAERLQISRAAVRRIADRSRAMQHQYEQRYYALRAKAVATAAAVITLALAAQAATLLLR